MTDIVNAFSMAANGLNLLSHVKKIGEKTVSAMFKWDATHVHGDSKIAVDIQYNENGDIWWYSVKSYSDFSFMRFPVIDSCLQEIPGKVKGSKNADAQYWRWIPAEKQGTIVGGGEGPNIKVDFVMVGFDPKALVNYFSSS